MFEKVTTLTEFIIGEERKFKNATGNFTKIVQRVPVRVSVNPEIVQQGILRPGLSVVVDVDTRTSAEPEKTASIKE